MNKLLLFLACVGTFSVYGQSFAPAPGEPGSTAIYKDSSCFTAWANGGTVVRGYIDINDTTLVYDGSNKASFGTIELAFGIAQGSTNILSLGDSGYATMTFPMYIMDGSGFDFAVFENSFDDHYMELGHVEVSSNGVHFFRFPSTSEIPTDEQLSNFGYSDCGYVNNLAGKYRAGYGTPFDLADLPDNALLDKNLVTHVRIVDAIGAISGDHLTTDQLGNVINDPYPTAFHSGGFDLDAVGVINGFVGLEEQSIRVTLSPNPTNGTLTIVYPGRTKMRILSPTGQVIAVFEHLDKSQFSFEEAGLGAGVYFLGWEGGTERIVFTGL